jgi:hypothetical protein
MAAASRSGRGGCRCDARGRLGGDRRGGGAAAGNQRRDASPHGRLREPATHAPAATRATTGTRARWQAHHGIFVAACAVRPTGPSRIYHRPTFHSILFAFGGPCPLSEGPVLTEAEDRPHPGTHPVQPHRPGAAGGRGWRGGPSSGGRVGSQSSAKTPATSGGPAMTGGRVATRRDLPRSAGEVKSRWTLPRGVWRASLLPAQSVGRPR